MGSISADSTNSLLKIFGEKSYVCIVADVTFVVRFTVVVSVLNMYVYFFLSFPKQYSITTVYIAFIPY